MPTTYYVDAINGSDSNNGLTPATAKQYYRTVVNLLSTTGDTILLARGMYHGVRAVSEDLPGIQKLGLTIDAYGTGGNPCFDGFTYEAAGTGGWTHEGSGVWSKQYGTTSSVKRFFTGSRNTGKLLSQRSPGTAQRAAPDTGIYATTDNVTGSIIPALTRGDGSIWYGAGATLTRKLYVFTGSTTIDPPTAYNGIAFIQSGTGTFGIVNAIAITKSHNITVSNVDVQGTAGESFLIYATDTDTTAVNNIKLTNCNSFYAFTSGFRIRQTTTQTPSPITISQVTLTNCTGNTSTSVFEQEPDSTKWSRLSGACDMFFATGRINDVRFYNCMSTNSFHSGLTLGALDANTSRPIDSGFHNCTVYADTWTTYTRGAAIYPCEESCYLTRCLFNGMNVRTQLSGSVKFYGNNFQNLRASIRKPNTSGVIAVESYVFDGLNASIGTERYVYIQPYPGLTIEHNFFGPSYDNPIEFNAYNNGATFGVASATFSDNYVTVANNVLMDTAPIRKSLPSLVGTQEGGVTLGDEIFVNNLVFKGAGQPDPTITYKGVSYAINANTGFSGNLTTDPQITNATSSIPSTSPLIGASVFQQYCSGFDGKPFKLPATIGSYEAYNLVTRSPRV